MPMPHGSHASPSPDAVVLRRSTLRLVPHLLFCLLLVGLGLAGLVGLVVGIARGTLTEAEGLEVVALVKGVLGLLFMMALGVLGAVLGTAIWAGRRTAVIVDRAGVWLDNGKAREIVPWDVLAGVGMYWSRMNRRVKQHSIELCPRGPIDDRDPVLWATVRDEEPIGPGLPRLRYRFPLRPGTQDRARAAIQQFAPAHLWLGEVERQAGHIGRPDMSRRPPR
ncbi:hypothetical protein ACWC2K_09855 [Streptomyces chattanoogensis]|uniref:hypothetical protein n=1 Tax=Streptomyces chattanoogensis TaxID=66876 RepID=UPI0036CF685F